MQWLNSKLDCYKSVVVANAPCSFGAFEITVPGNPHVPAATDLLDCVRDAGYAGVDLGPPGYLGLPAEVAERLADRGLGLAGGYLQLPLSEPDALAASLPELDRLLDVFASLAGQRRLPVATLADAGSAARRAHPGGTVSDPDAVLDEAGWVRFLAGLELVAERCRERGFAAVLHPHAGTFVEAGWEIERVLEGSDVELCFDPAHLVVGGVDPVAAMRAWGARVGHVHLKDVDRAALERLTAASAPVEEIYSSGAFCRLGAGSAAVETLLSLLAEAGYEGWLVVEQDLVPDSEEAVAQGVRDQVANREFLRARGL